MVSARPISWLTLSWEGIFLLDESGKKENYFSVKYLSQCKCWSVALRIHQTVRPDDVSFSVGFQLEGLGSTYGEADLESGYARSP